MTSYDSFDQLFTIVFQMLVALNRFGQLMTALYNLGLLCFNAIALDI